MTVLVLALVWVIEVDVLDTPGRYPLVIWLCSLWPASLVLNQHCFHP